MSSGPSTAVFSRSSCSASHFTFGCLHLTVLTRPQAQHLQMELTFCPNTLSLSLFCLMRMVLVYIEFFICTSFSKLFKCISIFQSYNNHITKWNHSFHFTDEGKPTCLKIQLLHGRAGIWTQGVDLLEHVFFSLFLEYNCFTIHLSESALSIYIYIPSLLDFPLDPSHPASQSTELSSLCYTAASH